MGRPSALTPTKHAEIVGHIAAGQSRMATAQLVGLSTRALEKWAARGRDALDAGEHALDQLPLNDQLAYLELNDTDTDPVSGPAEWVDIDGEGRRFWTNEARAAGYADSPRFQALLMLIPETEWPYVRFVRGVKRSESMSEAVLLGGIRRAGLGQEELETVTETHLDAEGQVVSVKTVERRRTVRSWQALAWILERRLPEVYGRPERSAQPVNADGVSAGTLEDERALGLAAIDELRARREQKGG